MAISPSPSYILNFNENQQKCRALEKLWLQRESGRFCDIVLHVQGQKFQAHKNVLAACSPYFDNLLKSHNGNDELLILCQSLEAFKFLLKFLYTGNISIDENNVSELLVLASHFLMDDLKNCCAEFLKQFLDMQNCLTVFGMSIEYDLQELNKSAIEYILNHTTEVFELAEVLDIPFDKIKVLLGEIKDFIPQYLLLDFICKWVHHNLNERTHLLKTLLSAVNWQCVESQFLENHLNTCPLLKESPNCLQTLVTCLNKNQAKFTQSPRTNTFLNSLTNCNDNKITSFSEPTVEVDPETTTLSAFDTSVATSDKTVLYSDTIDSREPEKRLSEVVGIFENVSAPDEGGSHFESAISNEIATDINSDHEAVTVQNDSEIVLSLTSSMSAENHRILNNDLYVIESNKSVSDFIDNKNCKTNYICSLPGHLNVLAEVTELFSNCDYNIKENDESIIDSTSSVENSKLALKLHSNVTINMTDNSNVCALPTKNVVHRPAIHYLSKIKPKDLVQSIDSNKRNNLEMDLNNINITCVYTTESDDFNLSLNDSNAHCNRKYAEENPSTYLSKTEQAASRTNHKFMDENSMHTIDNQHLSLHPQSSIQNVMESKEFIVYSKNVMHSVDDQKLCKKQETVKKSDSDTFAEVVPADAAHEPITEKIDKPQRRGWKRSIKCDTCSYVARTPHRLQKHVNTIHAKNITYKCKVCDFTCKWQKEYSEHLKTHFKGPPFSCDVCNYSNNRLPSLLAHRLTHTIERPFKCELCERKTRTKAELDYHIRRHTGEKPFQCETCHRAFALKSCLEQHVLSHGTERTYLCDMCGFSAKYKSHLLNHKRVHRGNVFRCEFEGCSYSTPVRNSFFAHRRIHTNDRPFLCRICGKSFIENSQMKRHERTHMDVTLFFNCDHCEYATTRRDRLKDHAMKYHSEGAKTIYKPRMFGRTKTSRSSNKKSLIHRKAVKTVSPTEPDVPAPPIVIAHGNDLPGQELVVVTSTLSKEHGPVTFLQVLPSSSNSNVAETKT